MSIEVFSYIISTRDPKWYELKSSKLLVMITLADRANEDGVCYPGIASIAERARVTERRAQQILRELETEGHIRTEFNEGINTQSGQTNRYYLIRYRIWKGLERGEEDFTPSDEHGVKPVSPHGVKPVSPKPSVEPSVEPSVKDSSAQAQNGTSKTEPETDAKSDVDKQRTKSINAIIDVWSGRYPQPTRKNVYAIKTYKSDAGDLYDAGCTSEKLAEFIDDLQKDPFWSDKSLSLEALFKRWKLKQVNGNGAAQVSPYANWTASS